MKIKVISDGTGVGTKIINEETGEEIKNATFLKIEVFAGQKNNVCELHLANVPFEFTGESQIKTE